MPHLKSKPKILLIGGLGYLGSRLALHFSEQWDVSVLTRTMTPTREAWLRSLSHPIHVFKPSSPMRFDVVVHLASPSAADCAKDPLTAQRQVEQTLGMCVAALRAGSVQRLIHFSSFHVYGTPPRPVYREMDVPTPSHPYGEVHLAGETILKDYVGSRPVFILRVTNGVGAPAHSDLGAQSGLLYLDCLKQIATTGKVVMKNDGTACRDFVSIVDIVRAVELLARASSPTGDILNVSHGTSVTLKKFVTEIAKCVAFETGRTPLVEWGNAKDPFSDPFEVNHQRLVGWGWNPRRDLYEEVISAYRFFQKAVAA